MRVLYFSAEWCQPCKKIYPKVERLLDGTGIYLQKVDVDQNPGLAEQYQVKSVPTIAIIGDGGLIGTYAGNRLADGLRLFLGDRRNG